MRPARKALAYAFWIFVAFLCGPVGARLAILFQTLPLPAAFYPVAKCLWGLAFLAMVPGFLMVGLGVPIAAFIALWSKRTRIHVPFLCLMSVVAWLGFPINWYMEPMKIHGLRNTVESAEPLIEAINRYTSAHDAAPEKLELLVPDYIDAIPSTGMVGYPTFRYLQEARDDRAQGFEIWVNTPTVGINFDSFVYWPSGNYADYMYGGGIERIDDWVYVHE